jgi:AcrR family transcriptional regulator
VSKLTSQTEAPLPAPNTRRTPAEFRTDYRRDQILAAAREVVAALGFERMSVGEVVKAAGLSRSTFYGYFTSKDDLLAGLLASGREILAASLRHEIDHQDSLEGQLAGFLRVCLLRVDANRDYFRAAVGLQPLQLSGGPGGLAALIADFDRELMRILTDAVTRGELSSDRTSQARDGFATLAMGAMTSRSMQPHPRPVQEVAAALARFAVTGLDARAVKGRSEKS